MTVTRKQLLGDPRSGARPLSGEEQAGRPANAALARHWLPAAAPAGAPGQPQLPAAAGRSALAAPATGPPQRSPVRSGDAGAANPQRVDANASMWRLRSLIAMGHTTRRIAAALGTTSGIINPLVTGERATVQVPLRDDINRLFDAWWDKHPPQPTPADKTAAICALQRAALHNWPCPPALDEDELDTPGYKPSERWRYAKGTGTAANDPLGKNRDPDHKQRHADLALLQTEGDAAGTGWRIPQPRQPGRQAEPEPEPEAV